MAQRPNFADGQTATNPTTGERIVYRQGRWLPLEGNVARNGAVINPKFQTTLNDQDARRTADVAEASRSALQSLPRIQELRGVIDSPDTQMGGFGPAAVMIDQFTPGLWNKAKDQADRMDSLSTQIAVPLARAMAPVSNTDFLQLRKSIADPAVSKPAARAALSQLQTEANRATWYNKKLGQWVQTYGAPSAPATQSYPGELEAQPGETFDQYFARWSEFNAPTLSNSRGAYAPELPPDMQRAGKRSLGDRMAYTQGGKVDLSKLSDAELLARLRGGR